MHEVRFADSVGVSSCHICCDLGYDLLRCTYCGRPVCRNCAEDLVVKAQHSTCAESGSYLD
jgi:hypothetical protein